MKCAIFIDWAPSFGNPFLLVAHDSFVTKTQLESLKSWTTISEGRGSVRVAILPVHAFGLAAKPRLR
jgi:hypothetical protein